MSMFDWFIILVGGSLAFWLLCIGGGGLWLYATATGESTKKDDDD